VSRTEHHLKEAFAGEAQANRKYQAFARKAELEGFPAVARLFRAAAEAETIHAHNHLRELGGIRSTRENLEEAIGGETHEFTAMYPAMIEEARAEGQARAVRSFELANAVEKIHADLYRKALAALDEKRAAPDYWVCSVCGMTVEGDPPDECPVCKAKRQAFRKVE
jgi:rubrerythrin